MGVFFQSGKNDLRLDIGASKDIVHYKMSDNKTISLGADFFTFTKLRGENDFHFPVDAVDYLFGFNIGYKQYISKSDEIGLRLRLSHISAHFVDGHFDAKRSAWRDDRNPLVYSREFFELIPYYRFKDIRTYIGISYLIHVSPEEVKPWIFQAGFDGYFTALSFGDFYPYFAYDYKLSSNNEYYSNHTAQFGLKLGKPTESGMRLVFTLYSGKNVHGEYYDVNDEYFSTGVTIDF